MRIRKRWPPPPSPPPDPSSFANPPDQSHRSHKELEKQGLLHLEDPPNGVGDEGGVVEEKAANATNRSGGCNPSAETCASSSMIFSSLPHHQGHWCEEDKVFPLKKRKVSLNSDNGSIVEVGERKKVNVREKRMSITKKRGDDEDVDEVNQVIEIKESSGEKTIESRRCSRMNGRGWRCNQPTLVGYSLCNHHLGNGKLKSKKNDTSKTISSAEDDNGGGGGNNGLMVAKKSKKINTVKVKSRSMSSLLGQTVPLPSW